MTDFATQLLENLEAQLNEIGVENDLIKAAENSIKATIIILEKLKTHFVRHEFENKVDEITFFKFVKPQFVSKLIYHNEVYNIESTGHLAVRSICGNTTALNFLN